MRTTYMFSDTPVPSTGHRVTYPYDPGLPRLVQPEIGRWNIIYDPTPQADAPIVVEKPVGD